MQSPCRYRRRLTRHIYNHELVEAVQRIAGNGTGDTRWKVPGVLDWSTGTYNPHVDISKSTTTLYAFSWSTTSTRSKLAASETARPTSISEASIAGTRKLGRRRSAW